MLQLEHQPAVMGLFKHFLSITSGLSGVPVTHRIVIYSTIQVKVGLNHSSRIFQRMHVVASFRILLFD